MANVSLGNRFPIAGDTPATAAALKTPVAAFYRLVAAAVPAATGYRTQPSVLANVSSGNRFLIAGDTPATAAALSFKATRETFVISLSLDFLSSVSIQRVSQIRFGRAIKSDL